MDKSLILKGEFSFGWAMQDIFWGPALSEMEKFWDHRRLMEFQGSGITIAGRGMCTGGRIMDHLDYGFKNSKNDIFLWGTRPREF